MKFQSLLRQLEEERLGITELLRDASLRDGLRTEAEALSILYADFVETLRELISASVTEVRSPEWQSQLRLYTDDGQGVWLRILNFDLAYGWEYLGPPRRLIPTKAIKRTQRILVSALQLGFGGLLEGPAATGKTECVKELSRLVGRQIHVFNCSESVEWPRLSALIRGAAASGLWLSLDELNRTRPSVLAQIPPALTSINQAIALGRAKASVDGEEFPLHNASSLALFATLNPNYVGRVALPESLRSLFRSIALLSPDSEDIVKVSLTASGFRSPAALAHAMVGSMAQAKLILSAQHHYDFRLRAVRATLESIGALKETTLESSIVATAVEETNRPQLIPSDVNIFSNIIPAFFGPNKAFKSADSQFHAGMPSSSYSFSRRRYFSCYAVLR